MHPALLKQADELLLNPGGCIKFDLKVCTKELYIALCGVSNEQTLENLGLLADYMRKRPPPPFLVASTLLVPGYIDKTKVAGIASFICSLSPNIPYALLAFHLQHRMNDLPPTPKRHAQECLVEAERRRLRASTR
jgi:pyruvate formate lyase activating enzyme